MMDTIAVSERTGTGSTWQIAFGLVEGVIPSRLRSAAAGACLDYARRNGTLFDGPTTVRCWYAEGRLHIGGDDDTGVAL